MPHGKTLGRIIWIFFGPLLAGLFKNGEILRICQLIFFIIIFWRKAFETAFHLNEIAGIDVGLKLLKPLVSDPGTPGHSNKLGFFF